MKAAVVLGLIIAAAAVAVGGWIGYRATEKDSAVVCFRDSRDDLSLVACVDPDDPAGTYRLTGLVEGRVVSLPSTRP